MKKVHYHLFPKDVAGLGYDKKNLTFAVAWGNRPSSDKPNAEGKYWWAGGDGIYVMRTMKFRRCDECNAEINCRWRNNPYGKKVVSKYGTWHVSTRTYTQREWYVGIGDSCWLYYWGVDNHLCLNCALKLLGKHYVYKCDSKNPGRGIGYYPDPPPDWVQLKEEPRLLFSDLLPKETWRKG